MTTTPGDKTTSPISEMPTGGAVQSLRDIHLINKVNLSTPTTYAYFTTSNPVVSNVVNGQTVCTWSLDACSTTNKDTPPKSSVCEIESNFSVGDPQLHLRKLYQDLDLSQLNSSGLHRLEILAKVGDRGGRVSDGIMTCMYDTHTEGSWNRKKAGCLSSMTTQNRNRVSYVRTNARKPLSTPNGDDDPNDPFRHKELDNTPLDAIDTCAINVEKQTFGELDYDDAQEPRTFHEPGPPATEPKAQLRCQVTPPPLCGPHNTPSPAQLAPGSGSTSGALAVRGAG
jgi:hypothetical protein